MSGANTEILNSFRAFAMGLLAIEDFQEQVAVAHWDIESSAPDMSSLVYRAVGRLSEYSRGHRDERSIREEIANAIRPFAVSTKPVQSEPVSSWGSRTSSFRLPLVAAGGISQGSVWSIPPPSIFDDFLIRVGE
jgi:hypothetical protein